MLRAGILMLALTLTACLSSATPTALSTDSRSYEPGEVVEIELRNTFATRIGYNLCFVQLQVRDGESWRSVSHLAPNEACTSELRIMPRGGSAKGQITLPRDLEDGTYRLSHDVEVGDDRQTISSGTFEVQD